MYLNLGCKYYYALLISFADGEFRGENLERKNSLGSGMIIVIAKISTKLFKNNNFSLYIYIYICI